VKIFYILMAVLMPINIALSIYGSNWVAVMAWFSCSMWVLIACLKEKQGGEK
jgi:hypothetical protein